MHSLDWLICLAALPGHLGLWLAITNRLHAVALRQWLISGLTLVGHLVQALVPLALGYWLWQGGGPLQSAVAGSPLGWAATWYVLLSVMASGPVGVWLVRRLAVRPPEVLRTLETVSHDLAPRLPETARPTRLGRIMARVPGNQSLRLDVHEKTLEIPRLPPQLDGLTIAHLTDLHFTGKVAKEYFQEVVRLTNEFDADLVALTGDLVEKSTCIPWIPETLGRLRGRHGVYFVLGNHDTRIDVPQLREAMTACGLNDVGGCWRRLVIRGEVVILAGNELPWIVPAADMSDCPPRDRDDELLKILLAHTPDQFGWARRHDFDLMLAGHTHGGQIQVPLLGPLVAPSWHGVRYASGTFHLNPTVMHVSRGVSSNLPLRWNCPPELTRLTLRRPTEPARAPRRRWRR